MVGEEDGLGTVLDGLLSILDSLDTLGNDRQGSHVLELAVHVPSQQTEFSVC